MKEYNSLKSNFSATKPDSYGKKFIHDAIVFISKNRGLRMQHLECRLWIVGMLCDPTLKEDFLSFAGSYFNQDDSEMDEETRELLKANARYFNSIRKEIKK